jgi:2-polyprenyl-3-methyl-5-hydroxy-6-metoxy-1,4-benzoquinol methylase
MSEPVDYFTNHAHKMRFPWRLYHGPIIEALRAVVRCTRGDTMLNIGSGPFFELDELGVIDKKVTLCDIDPRAIELARDLHGDRIQRFDVTESGKPLPYADSTFDLVVSMDVIEHVADPASWLHEALRVLRPSGTLFLTTPNYSSLTLRILESTALELIARRQGFSRKLLHPSKMTRDRLARLLAAVGGGQSEISAVAFGWVLTSATRKIALGS